MIRQIEPVENPKTNPSINVCNIIFKSYRKGAKAQRKILRRIFFLKLILFFIFFYILQNEIASDFVKTTSDKSLETSKDSSQRHVFSFVFFVYFVGKESSEI